MIASIRILYTLIETGQIRDFAGIKQYLAYIVKCMELATQYQWRSVLEYDDYFRQLQAHYGLSWTYENHHMHTVILYPLGCSGRGGSESPKFMNSSCARNRSWSGGSNVSDEIATYTADGYL